jgi:RHS repeat-associated protein
MLLGLGGRMYAADASISVSGTEQQVSGSWDTGTVTVSFGDSLGHTFSETVAYGQFSSAASIASTFGATFSRDFIGSGLCAHAVGSVIYFHLKGVASFGPVSVSGSTVSFHLDTSLWPTNFINPPIALVCSPDTLISGNTTSCTASLPASATGTIVFSVDGSTTLAAVTLASGTATASSLLATASPGGHIVTAAYSGDGTHAASSAFITVIVSTAAEGGSGGGYQYNIGSGYAGNGNITSYTDSVNGAWSNITYDALDRITAATQNGTLYFCWAYDSFGNRISQATSDQAFSSGSGDCASRVAGNLLTSVSAHYVASNQMDSSSLSAPMTCPAGSVASSSNGYCYDAAGDMTADGANQYLYDDEGRVCAVLAPPVLAGWPVNMVQYIYDAEGRRVAKGAISTFSCDNSINGDTGLPNNGFTLTNSYALGLSGEQVTETGGDGQWLHTNVFVGGQLLSTYDDGGVHFHMTDWLGNRRVQTDYIGAVEATYQNLPFGEMVPQNNSVFLGATEHHFTGKERDTETGNDYMFARYYNSSTGRFLSPDWSAKEEPVPYAKLDDPQSLNLYSYVLNNPLSNIDPDGHDCPTCKKVWNWLTSSHSASASKSATAAQSTASGSGLTVTAKVGTADAKASASYGKKTGLSGGASATFIGVTGQEGSHGNTAINAFTANAGAHADAGASVSADGKRNVGMSAGAGANADILTGSQTVTFSIGPVTFTGTATGNVGFGANASYSVGTGGVGGSAGLTDVVGGAVSFGISWGPVTATTGASGSGTMSTTSGKVDKPQVKVN